MQIIQGIREKGTVIVFIVIALSLIGFLLMDSRTGSNNQAGSLGASVGSINGNDVELGDYQKKVDNVIAQQEQRTGQSVSGTEASQMRETAWQQVVAENVFFAEAEKLGIGLTPAELTSILLSNDPNNPFLQEQSLKDSMTGMLDPVKASEALKNIKKFKGEQRDAVTTQLVEPLRLNMTAAKYTGLINAGTYYASWMKERDMALANNFATIQYAAIPYPIISDSTIKITDADVNAYVEKNKSLFKQDAGRRISYVTFSQLPSTADSAALMAEMNTLKNAFAADSNPQLFVSRNGSIVDFQDQFLPKSRLQSSQMDSVLKYPQGAIVGPYVDNGAMVLAKVLGSKIMPDSVGAKHILIGVNNPQTGQAIREDGAAKKLADSLLAAIKAGANFQMLAAQYSDDASNKMNGGDLGTFAYGQMVPEFNDYVFSKPVGELGVVQTSFGYHILSVTKQTNFNQAYKVVFLAKDIIPADATINNANTAASKAASQKNGEALLKYAAANGLGITKEPTLIKENDFQVGALADARQLVQWAFKAKTGEVSEPFNINDQFVVATIDKVEKEGLQDAAAARSGAEPIIIKQKKAAIIREKLGANPTVESAAQKYGVQVATAGADSSITMVAQMVNGIGIEPKLVGAAFNKAYIGKVTPIIEGTNGVYVARVIAVSAKAPMSAAEQEQFINSKKTAYKSQANGWFEGLKAQADIKDKRSKYF